MDKVALDQLAQAYDGCTIAAFADLDVGIVLRTAESCQVGQEGLNKLCAKAKDIFDALATASNLAMQASKEGTLIFVRAADDPTSVLMARCDSTVALNEFVEQARACVGGGS